MDILKFVELVDVENNFAFLPRDGLTFCNCYAKVVLAHAGFNIPNASANDLHEWFATNSAWSKFGFNNTRPAVDFEVAILKADPHGHIAVKCGDMWTSAGKHNHKFASFDKIFGLSQPDFFQPK